MAEHAALRIDTIGHQWVQWMGVRFVFFFFFQFGWGLCLKSANKGQFMSATRLGIVSSTAKILLLLSVFCFLFSEFMI